MSRNERRRDVLQFDRRARRSIEGTRCVSSRGPLSGPEAGLLEVLAHGGPPLPAATRTEQLEAAYLERGKSLREQVIEAEREGARTTVVPRARTRPAFARVAVVTTVVIALLLGLGAGSAFAMPGNPLYSVRRAGEAVYVSLVPGAQGKADTYASLANRRIDELEYVEDRDISKWYYSLVRDAEGSIESTYGNGRKLKARAEERVMVKARAATLRLEALLGKAYGGMTPAQKGSAESGLERLRLRLRMQKGGPSGPSQQPGQPGEPGSQPGSPQGSTPGGPQTQPGTPQEGQPNQPGTPQQGEPAQPGTPQQGQPNQQGGPGQTSGSQVQQSAQSQQGSPDQQSGRQDQTAAPGEPS